MTPEQESAAKRARSALQHAVTEILTARALLDAAFGERHDATAATDAALDYVMIAKRKIGGIR